MIKQNRTKLSILLSCLFLCCCTDTLIQETDTVSFGDLDILAKAKLIIHNYGNTFSLPNIQKRSDTIQAEQLKYTMQ